MTDIYAEFGGSADAIIGGGSELTDHEKAMLNMPVSVRDGDDLIQMDAPQEETEEVEEPEGTEQEEEGEEQQEEETVEEEESEVDPDVVDVDTAGADFQKYMREQESLIEDAIAKGLPSNIEEILRSEYEKGEGFSEQTYASLEKAGYSKAFVDSYVRGQDALAERFVNSIYNFAGGKKEFERTASFLGTHNKDLAEAFNDAVMRTDVKAIKAILNTTKAQMVSMFGTKPARDVTTRAKPVVAAPAPTVQPFANSTEMVKAMSDKRYQTDTAYRLEVEKRVGASRF